jgi:hypothetical protein
MMVSPRFITAAVLAAISAGLLGFAANAEPLDKEACANLQVERKKLLTAEMKAALEHGPDWVKDHLNEEEIEQVRQFLVVEEKIEFRCRGGGVAKSKPEDVAKPETEEVARATPEGIPLPDRKPGSATSATADVKSSQDVADSNGTPPQETGSGEPVAEPVEANAAEAGPSQTLADSDKTAPAKTKATR